MSYGHEEIYEEVITYDEHGRLIRKVKSLKRDLTEEEAAQFTKVRNIASIANMAIDLLLHPFLERHGLMGPPDHDDEISEDQKKEFGRVEKVIDAEFSVKPAPPPPPLPAPPKAAPRPPSLPPPPLIKFPPLRLPAPKPNGNGKK